jgi:hypothetical protein
MDLEDAPATFPDGANRILVGKITQQLQELLDRVADPGG